MKSANTKQLITTLYAHNLTTAHQHPVNQKPPQLPPTALEKDFSEPSKFVEPRIPRNVVRKFYQRE